MSVSHPLHDVAVYVGRFQPFHAGHLALLQQALALAGRCVVVIGSAHQARTPKNPFTWRERAEMIRLALPEAERERVDFVPVRDYYDEARWVRAVRAQVGALCGGSAKVALISPREISAAQSAAARLAPPTSTPSISRRASSAPTLPAFTLPP